MDVSALPAQEAVPLVTDRRGFTTKEKVTIALTSLGGALEFFDFTVFIFLTPILAQVFFPASQPSWIRQLSTLSIFALGWFARPVGGTIIAHFGDRFGRKRLFTFTILFMAIPTLATALLPSYETAGLFSPLVLIVLRLMQGIAIGGEVPGALTFVAEHVSRSRLGLACSLFGAMLYAGLLLGSGLTALVSKFVPHDALLAWGWRIPFVIGGLAAFFVVYMRRSLSETPVFETLKKAGAESKRFPLGILFRDYRGAMAFAVLYAAQLSVLIVGLFTYLPTPLQLLYGLPKDVVLQANAAAIGALVVVGPAWGYLGDRIGLHRAFGLGCFATLAATLWFFYQLPSFKAHADELFFAWIALGAACAFVCMVPALVTQTFTARIRYTGFALPYNIGLAVFTGLLPIMVTLLDRFVGRHSLPVLTVAVCAIGILMARTLPALQRAASQADKAALSEIATIPAQS